MKKFIIVLVLIFLNLPAYAQDANFCKDKDSWQEWDTLVQKYPHDMDIQMLHAVRIGFCKKIEDGTISFETARDAFNHLHDTVVKKSKNEKNQMLKNKQL